MTFCVLLPAGGRILVSVRVTDVSSNAVDLEFGIDVDASSMSRRESCKTGVLRVSNKKKNKVG